jgi:hypothetical protein
VIDGQLTTAPLILAGAYQLQDGMKVRLSNAAEKDDKSDAAEKDDKSNAAEKDGKSNAAEQDDK